MPQRQILCCDIGGTNTSIALVSIEGTTYTKHTVHRYQSQELASLQEALDDVLHSLPVQPEALVCSGAGHIIDQVSYLSNLSWNIDAQVLADFSRLPCLVVNDFTAISYSLPIIQHDRAVVTELQKGSLKPSHKKPVYVVIGAGTGLGVGALIHAHNTYIAVASEGGHADVLPMDDQTEAMFLYWRKKLKAPPGAEFFISGPGIYNIAEYFIACEPWESPDVLSQLRSADKNTRPALVAQLKDTDPQCKRIWDIFIRLFARFTANACMFFGLYTHVFLAGGIIAKNVTHTQQSGSFYRAFCDNYTDLFSSFLSDIPISIITDYNVSLTGAAHAYTQLGAGRKPS